MSHLQIVWLGNLKTECLHPGGERILTDAPKEIGGEGSAFSPTDLFALSLGTCLLTVMGLEARRLDVDLTGSRVEVDKEMSTNSPRRIARLLVRFYGPLMASESNRKSLDLPEGKPGKINNNY